MVHEETITKGTEYRVTKGTEFPRGAVVAQLASARLSEREVSGSIFSDFNVWFDFPLIRVAIALNTRKKRSTDSGREGRGRTVGFHW